MSHARLMVVTTIVGCWDPGVRRPGSDAALGPDTAGPVGTPATVSAGGDVGAILDAGSNPVDDASASTDIPSEAPPGIEPMGLPLPADVPPPRRILGPSAELTSVEKWSCSHQEPASGDGSRWCVFSIPSSVPERTELWVINVSAAATGEIPVCDGTDRGCLRMTDNLWTEFPLIGPGHPYAHTFQGDTLIFYANATSAAGEIHRGPVYAWRPGWPHARQISSDRGLACYGHKNTPAAWCIDDAVGEPQTIPQTFELRAGSIADPAGGVLPSGGRYRLMRADGLPGWQAAFSANGDRLIFSSPDPDPAVEVLRMVAIADVDTATPTEVLKDVTSWTIGNDGKRIYFLRTEVPGIDSLFSADFPAGSNVRKLGSGIRDYVVLGDDAVDRGVGFLTEVSVHRASFGLLRDYTMPASVQELFSYEGNLEDMRLSSDARYTAWEDEFLRVRVVRHRDGASCLLNNNDQSFAFETQFLANAGLVFWIENVQDDPGRQDGFSANPDGCQDKRRFARDMDFFQPIDDRGLIFGDEFQYLDRTVTLKYARVSHTGDAWQIDEPVRIQDHVHTELSLVGRNPLLVVFRVQDGGSQPSGIYLFGPVPF